MATKSDGNQPPSPLGPKEIRSIRLRLGLTQADAGDLLGGGPSGFAKYERGDVSPSAALTNLLRLVEADPSLIDVLRGGLRRPMVRSRGYGPFRITGEHITVLETPAFVELLDRLLRAEVRAKKLSPKRILVPSNVNAPDGGEDGSIEWEGGPERTDNLPRRQVAFQLKNKNVFPKDAAAEVIQGSKSEAPGSPKEQVARVIRAGGCYVVLCSRPYVHKKILSREQSIRQALRKAGLSVDDSQVEFRGADQIAGWVNEHPPVAMWVLELTQPGTVGPFRSWTHWNSRSEHNRTPWIDDRRLASLQRRLVEQGIDRMGVLHVLGLSGVGKTRLLLEAFRDGELAAAIRDLVMYTDESEHNPATITETVQTLADTGKRAVVVVDRCSPDTRGAIAKMVRADGSRLSLVTIQDERPSATTRPDEVLVPNAPLAVIEGIVGNLAQGLPSEDTHRLIQSSQGYPELAISSVWAWRASRPIGHITEHGFVMTFIQATVHESPELIVKSAQLLAAFGLIGTDEEFESRLEEVARAGGLDADRLNEGIQHLADIGVAQRRGRLFVLEPRPIALHLAERQWKAWLPKRWDQVLTGRMDPESRVSAARQLRLLNRTEIAQKVVKHVCRPNGPLGGPERILDPAHTETLAALVEVSPRWVVELIDFSLSGFEDLSEIRGDARRNLVWTLEKAAFPEDTFDGAARLLLRLAVAENEPCANNATGVLADLFPMRLGKTAADASKRLRFLQDAANSTDPKQREVIVQALTRGVESEHSLLMVGAGTHGLQPSLDSWLPKTRDEVSDYLKACARQLAKLAEGHDDAGATARYELAHSLRSFIPNDLFGIDFVEEIARQVRDARGQWTEAIEALKQHLELGECPPALSQGVKGLIEQLRPRDLELRTLYLVSQDPSSYVRDEDMDDDAREERLRQDVASLSDELLNDTITLSRVLPELIDRPRSQATWLGECLAGRAASALHILKLIKAAYVGGPEGGRNDDLLAGFLRGLRERDPEAVERFKEEAAQSAQLAGTLPRVCKTPGVTSGDIRLVLQALEANLLSPKRLQEWAVRDCFESVPKAEQAHLIEELLAHSAEAFFSAIWIMHSQCFSPSRKLDGFLPQIRIAAEKVMSWEHARFNGISDSYFEQLMEEALKRGREDPDAQAVASALAGAFVRSVGPTAPKFLERLLPTLLERFPEITWQFIGAAVLAEGSPVWRFEFAMRGPLGPRLERGPVITRLPAETLIAWCRANPCGAPAFAAATLPVFDTTGDGTAEPKLDPTLKRVIDEFGDCEGVLKAVGRNMSTFSWSRSEEAQLRLYRAPLRLLCKHKTPAVSRWAESQLLYFDEWIRKVRSQLEEQEAEFDA